MVIIFACIIFLFCIFYVKRLCKNSHVCYSSPRSIISRSIQNILFEIRHGDYLNLNPTFKMDSAARLSKRPGCIWNYRWGHVLYKSPGVNRKSEVWYPGPGFRSNAAWPSMSNYSTGRGLKIHLKLESFK